MFHVGGEFERFQNAKWSSRSFKDTADSAIRYATYDFLLVFHCDYVSILHVHRFQDVINYFPKLRGYARNSTHFLLQVA